MKLYLAVTPDRLELPLCVADSPRELAQKFGVTKNLVLSSIAHNHNGKARGAKFIRIEVEVSENGKI